jgi:hypothetical protein
MGKGDDFCGVKADFADEVGLISAKKSNVESIKISPFYHTKTILYTIY